MIAFEIWPDADRVGDGWVLRRQDVDRFARGDLVHVVFPGDHEPTAMVVVAEHMGQPVVKR